MSEIPAHGRQNKSALPPLQGTPACSVRLSQGFNNKVTEIRVGACVNLLRGREENPVQERLLMLWYQTLKFLVLFTGRELVLYGRYPSDDRKATSSCPQCG